MSQMSIAEFSESTEAKKSSMGPLSQENKAPSLALKENKELPGVRKDVKLVYTEERGRHLVATEDIMPGNLVVIK